MVDTWLPYPLYPGNTQSTANDIPGRLDIANAADYNVHDREILAHQALLITHDGYLTILNARVDQALLTTSSPTFSSATFTTTTPTVPVAFPTAANQLTNKGYVDSLIAGSNELSEILANGNSAGAYTINMNSNKITSLGTPTANADAVTKLYVDSQKMSSDVTYYIDTAGSDITGDGSVSLPFRTVQHALDTAPKNLNGYNLNIYLNDGTHDTFYASSFYGGYVNFYSSSVDPELVTITSGATTYAAEADFCSAFLAFYDISFLCEFNSATGLALNGSSSVYLLNCLFGDDGIATGTYGVINWLSMLSMDDCYDIDSNKVTSGIISYGSTQTNAATVFGDTFALPEDGGYVVQGDGVYLTATDSFLLTPEEAPTVDYQVANKKYVDDTSAGVNEFVELNDTPASYAGMAASGVRVKATADGLEFYDPGSTDIDTLDVILGRGNTSATNSITLSAGTVTAAQLISTNDIYTENGNITASNGTISAEQVTSTDDMSVSDTLYVSTIAKNGGSLITVNDSVSPSASGTKNLGTVSLAFNNANIDQIYLKSNPTLPLQAATKQYVDTAVLGENLWDRSGTILTTHTAGDSVSLGGTLYNSASGIFQNISTLSITASGSVDVEGDVLVGATNIYKLNDKNFMYGNTDRYSYFFGEAGNTTTTGWDNVGIGFNALHGNTTGSENVAIGYKNLEVNTEGSYNTVVGYNSLVKNTTGSYNAVVGDYSMINNTTGWDNSCLGENTLYKNTTGNWNVAVGACAGLQSYDGKENVFVGFDAARNNSLYYGADQNTIVGCYAGYKLNGIGNVFLGYNAGYNETGSGKLYIDNSLTATPLIYGDFNSDYLKIYGDLYLSASGIFQNLSTTSIQASGNLTVKGNLTVDSSVLFVDSALDRVGIGTAAPEKPFHIVGSMNAPARVDEYVDGAVTGVTIQSRVSRGTIGSPAALQTGDLLFSAHSLGRYSATSFTSGAKAAVQGYIAENWSDTAQGTYLSCYTTPKGTTTNTERIRVTDTGAVGIGTITPASKLEVVGTISSTEEIRGTGLDASGALITHVLDPISNQDAATKKYVDDQLSGENLWDRTGTILTTHTAGDTISLNGPLLNSASGIFQNISTTSITASGSLIVRDYIGIETTTPATRFVVGSPSDDFSTWFTSSAVENEGVIIEYNGPSGARGLGLLNTATSGASSGGGYLTLIQNDGTIMASGERLGGISLGGGTGQSGANSIKPTTAITSFATQAWVYNTSFGSDLRLQITPNNSTVRTTKLWIDGATGFITIGAQSTAAAMCDIYSASNTQALRIRGTTSASQYADFYVDGSNDLNIDSTGITRLKDQVITSSSITTSGNLLVSASGTYNIGTIPLAFSNAYIDQIYLKADPLAPLQAATKQYVDNAVFGENLWDRTGTVLSTYNAGDTISVAPDTDTTHYLGRAAIGYDGVASDWMLLAHYDILTNTTYALGQGAAGQTLINAATGQYVGFNINNVSYGTVDLDGVLHRLKMSCIGDTLGASYNWARTGGDSFNALWYSYLPANSTDLRWLNGSDLMTLTTAGDLSITGIMTAPTHSATTPNNTFQPAVYIQRVGSGTAFDTQWINYLPNSSTDLRWYNGSDKIVFSAAGNITAAGQIRGVGLDASGSLVSNVLDPVSNQDAATKKYVDDQITGENLWDRSGTVLTTHTAGDVVSLSGPLINSASGVFQNISTTSIQASGNITTTGDIIYPDSRGYTNNLGKMTTSLSELATNTLLDKSRSTLSCVGTTLTYTLIATDGAGTWNFDGVVYPQAVASASVNLTAGTDASPQVNYVNYYLVGDVPTLRTSLTYPTDTHIDVATWLVGTVSGGTYTIYSYDRNRYEVESLPNRVIHRFEKQGTLYSTGFIPTVTQTTLSILSGATPESKFFNGIFEMTAANTVTATSFYYIKNGVFATGTTLAELLFYSNGDAMSASAYANVVWGVVPTTTTAGGTVATTVKLVAVLQTKPATKYSLAEARQDTYELTNYYPPNDAVRQVFTPICRTILSKNTGDFQTFDTGLYYKDLRGKITSGGGAATPTDLSGLVPYTGATTAVDLGSHNLTTTGDITAASGVFQRMTAPSGIIDSRFIPRVLTITSSATPAINTDLYDAVNITALATPITSMTTSLSGVPNNFDRLTIRFKDNGTAQALAWGTSYEAKGVPLPTTTVLSKVLTTGLIFDTVTNKWGCVSSAQET